MTNDALFSFDEYLGPANALGGGVDFSYSEDPDQVAEGNAEIAELFHKMESQFPLTHIPDMTIAPTQTTASDVSNHLFWPTPPIPFPFLGNTGYFFYPSKQGIQIPGLMINGQFTSPLWYPNTPSPVESTFGTNISFSSEDSEQSGNTEDAISFPSSSSSSYSVSNGRRPAVTRASRAAGAHSFPAEIIRAPQPPERPKPMLSSGRKRNIAMSEYQDEFFSDHNDNSDANSDDSDCEDEYVPSSLGSSSEEESNSERLSSTPCTKSESVLSKASTLRAAARPAMKASRCGNRSGSKSKVRPTKKTLLNSGLTKTNGVYICGLVVQRQGKAGKYTAKGMKTPSVGDICLMQTNNWSDMVRHQQRTLWHCPSESKKQCKKCGREINARADNFTRHEPICKGKASKKAQRGTNKKAKKH